MAVVAVPIRKLYPVNLDASNPASVNTSVTLVTNRSRDSERLQHGHSTIQSELVEPLPSLTDYMS